MTEEKTFKEQAVEALTNYSVRASVFEIDDSDPAFVQGQDYIYMSELDAHEGPFFTSSQLHESVHCFAERALAEIESMKNDDELSQMEAEDRLYYLGKLDAYADFLRVYAKEDR